METPAEYDTGDEGTLQVRDARTEPHCVDCGDTGLLHRHHVKGRQVDPKHIVLLCPNCHHRHHMGMLLFDNHASRLFSEWEVTQTDRYIPWQERLDKLSECGYVPAFDGWEHDQIAEIMAYTFHAQSPRALQVYLSYVGAQYLYPGDPT